MSIRIVIADDQAVVHSGFRAILEDEPDLEVVGDAEDGLAAVELARRRGADVVLMDIRMPRLDGLQATRRLAGPGVEHPIDVIVVTTFDLDDYVFGALRAGAAGFLLKDASPETLLAAIRAVANGQGLIAPQVTRRLIARFAATTPDPARGHELEKLSEREREVLLEVAHGRSNGQIARRLFIEEATVKSHVSSVLLKLGLHSRVQAVILACETGLVSPGTQPKRPEPAAAPACRHGRTLAHRDDSGARGGSWRPNVVRSLSRSFPGGRQGRCSGYRGIDPTSRSCRTTRSSADGQGRAPHHCQIVVTILSEASPGGDDGHETSRQRGPAASR
jgi:DNA-binding NarL/FixJ family response regulator